MEKLGFVAHVVRTNQTIKKVFWLLFLKKVTARRAGEYALFLFAKLFLLGLLLQKKKRINDKLLS